MAARTTIANVTLWVTTLGVLVPAKQAHAQTATKPTAPVAVAEADESIKNPALSLDPSAPQTGALPGGMTPAYGQEAGGMGDWRFDYHGQFTMPLAVGINSRADQQEGESDFVLHAPPQVPGDKETFSYTNAIPLPYAQLNLSYGNSIVTGTVILAAEQASIASGFFEPASQFGINDVFLDIRHRISSAVNLHYYLGAFSNRYGTPGEYDEGRYGTPLIARTNGAGEAIVANLQVAKDWTILLEQGLLGQSNKVPADLTPEAWNDFADPNVGASFVTHLHGGLAFRRNATLGMHYLHAWSQDDQATGRLAPDGYISVLGGDLRLNMGRFGHLYGSIAQTRARNSRTVGRIIEVLNSEGGPGLIENYLGPQSNGNGEILTFGAQYDLSIGKLVSYPVPFSGDGPDIFVSLFMLGAHIDSEDPTRDGVLRFKRGIEASYGLLSWFAASFRWDQVDPNMSNTRESFMILSPRMIFRTDWQATNQVVLQYSRYINGSMTTVRTGYPPRDDLTAIPDENVISLSASMWW